LFWIGAIASLPNFFWISGNSCRLKFHTIVSWVRSTIRAEISVAQ
jgi:hypothetical protein